MSISSRDEENNYDWRGNCGKWRGLLSSSLSRVLYQVHPTLMAQGEALDYVEGLILRLLAMLTTKPTPITVSDVSDRVSRTFPTPIDKWALNEAQGALSRGRKRANLVLPLDKIHSLLSKEVLVNKIDDGVTLFIVAVLEYISADILKLAGNYVKNIRHVQISCQDIKVAMCADKGQVVLMDMFYQDEVLTFNDDELANKQAAQTYDEVVKDLIMDEKQYLRDLHMITKVFRELFQTHNIGTQWEFDQIFSNITDITELTMTLTGSLEDTLEMTEEGNVSAVGSCFEELAEAEEFDVYDKYSTDVLSESCRSTLDSLVSKPEVCEALLSSGHGFREAVKFYLPKLLLGPVYHCFHYFIYIEQLMKLTPSKEERDILKQVTAMLSPLHMKLSSVVQSVGSTTKRKPGDIFHKYGPCRMSRQQSLFKLNQLQHSIVGWEGKEISSNSSELVCEGKLKILDGRRKLTERYIFLCDGLIIICKHITKRTSISGSQPEYRFVKRYLIRRMDIYDREDDDTFRHTFELEPRDQPRIVFKAESAEEKNNWMAALVMLNTKSMLERTLDLILFNEEKKHPLKFPPSHLYKFLEPNSPQNIVFEQTAKTSGVPLIKGATLIKLIERLTYHVYADPMFMKTFLTTYRSFSNPNELLDLLIDRFHIPDPEFSSDSESESEEKSSKIRNALEMKRFRREYSQPVQFRVLNVLKHWVDQHFYDFEQDLELLHKLTSFLDQIAGKSMKKWVECISKIVQRRLSNEESNKGITFDFDRSPPPVEEFIKSPDPDWPKIMTYHPIEIARQLTLLEFSYYRAVKPSELVDQAWTREDKDKRSPNLLRMVRHTTNFTRTLEKLIVETENIEERGCLVQRILEIMLVLQEHNNFNGVLAITSALNSSAVHRLQLTKDKVANHLLKSLEEASSYIEDHFKIYWEKLRSINPPCVPFFGQYQTNILFLEEGNLDFLPPHSLINFSKRRKVAEIISEIQQYQNQPYCLSEVKKLKDYLENLEPFPELCEKEITDHLWQHSITIEPRVMDAAAKKKVYEGKIRWKGLTLRSPGIKPKNLPGKNHPNPLPKIRTHSVRSGGDAEDPSPITSPVYQSPASGPSTPTTSPPDSDPIKIPVILPSPIVTNISTGGSVSTSLSSSNSNTTNATTNNSSSNTTPLVVSKPPPLPPKPSKSTIITSDIPPLPPRDSSSPPPIPPRLISRSPLMDPVLPRRNSSSTQSPPTIVPRRHSGMTGAQSTGRYPAPPPLNLRAGSEGTSPNSSPLWCQSSSPCWSSGSSTSHSQNPRSCQQQQPSSSSSSTTTTTNRHQHSQPQITSSLLSDNRNHSDSHFTFDSSLSGPPSSSISHPNGTPQLPPRPPPYKFI
nr:protein son of sevenless-like isoform X1 [Lepeophtheirus salmonis]